MKGGRDILMVSWGSTTIFLENYSAKDFFKSMWFDFKQKGN
jgi:hypothetical protein